jgi:hypothetical protein
MRLRAWLSYAACGAVLLLSGCGAWNVLPYSAAPAASPLSGNWLVVGSLSSFGPTFPQGQSQSPFNLAVSLDVTDGKVTGYATTAFVCANSGGFFTDSIGGARGLVTASIGADGSFELQPPVLGPGVPTVTFGVRGMVPQTAAATWSGTYTATATNNGCTSTSASTSGAFTAVPIMPVTGTYAASGTLSSQGSSGSTLVRITATFQQGAVGVPSTSTRVNSQNILNGNIVVQGSPCFSSGAINPMEGAVLGGFVQAEYTMNDGSELLVSGYIHDASVSTIELVSFLVSGGQCDKEFGFFGTSLVRQ